MTYIRLEDDIKKLYLKLGVRDTSELNLETIADRLNFSVFYINGISKYIDSHKTFYLTRQISPQEQWQEFGHELCHALWHAGSQLNMSIGWRMYQEWQANSFAYEACVPRFMLEKELAHNPATHPVLLISEKFGVTKAFAMERYIIHIRRSSQRTEELFQSPHLY